MFPSSAPKKPASALPSSAPERPNAPPSPASSTDERPPRVEYDVDEAERAREIFVYKGKPGTSASSRDSGASGNRFERLDSTSSVVCSIFNSRRRCSGII